MTNLIINIIINIWLVLHNLQSSFFYIILFNPQGKKPQSGHYSHIHFMDEKKKKQMKLIYIHTCLII